MRVGYRSDEPILTPEVDEERSGIVPNVVFPTGLTHDEESDELRLYYGAADSTIAVATAKYSEVLEYVMGLPEQL